MIYRGPFILLSRMVMKSRLRVDPISRYSTLHYQRACHWSRDLVRPARHSLRHISLLRGRRNLPFKLITLFLSEVAHFFLKSLPESSFFLGRRLYRYSLLNHHSLPPTLLTTQHLELFFLAHFFHEPCISLLQYHWSALHTLPMGSSVVRYVDIRHR